MKLNLSNPATGLQKIVEVDDEKKLLPFFEKRMGAEVSADCIGDEFKGYVFKITGGNDKQGFPMMQGVLTNQRVRLLFKEGMKCFRPRRKGEKKRKSVRGCIVGPDLSVLCMSVVKKGNDDIPGLTDGEKPRRLGPKRASHIRKLFNLGKEDNPCQYVVRRTIEGKKKSKAPKVQRLITKTRLQRKRARRAFTTKKRTLAKEAQQQYEKVVSNFRLALKEKRAAELAKKKKIMEKKSKSAAAEGAKAAAAGTEAPSGAGKKKN